MIQCGTFTFTDPDDYRTNVPGATINLVVTASESFRSRLTRITLRHLNVVLVEQFAPSISFLSFTPASAFVSFPLGGRPDPIWNGLMVRRGDFVFHRRGDSAYHRTSGIGRWGLISLSWHELAAYGSALSGLELAPPREARFLRTPRRALTEVLRLHREACRLARTDPDIVMHKKVARALEHDLIFALIDGLSVDSANRAAARGRRLETMERFERLLASANDRQLSMTELAAGANVPARVLREYCAEFLGMSPGSYARLRRLNLARSALLRCDPVGDAVGTVAKAYGFSELGRFAAAYRQVFGEAPSATLRNGRLNVDVPARAHTE